MVPVTGLEPVRGCPRGILSPLRLPIPPHQRTHCVILDCMDLRAKHCSIELINANGWRWIRTTEAICSRFTVCPLWPLGNLPIYQSLIVLTNIDYSITPCCVQGVFMHFLHFLFCHFLFFRILSLQNDSCMLWQCNIQSSIDDVIADRRNGVSIFTGKKYLF